MAKRTFSAVSIFVAPAVKACGDCRKTLPLEVFKMISPNAP